MKKEKEKYNKIATTIIISLLILMFIFSMIVSSGRLKLLNYSKLIIVFGGISLGYLITVYVKKINKISINHFIILLLIVLGIISCIFAINPSNSIMGSVTRYEGILIIISYYLFYLVSSTIDDNKYKKILFNILLIIGLFNVVYGILQAYNIEFFFGFDISKRIEYVSGVTGNSNFYSAMMLMFYSLAVGGYYSKQTSILYVFPFSFAVLLANSMTGIITLIVIFVGLLTYGIFILKKKKIYEYLLRMLCSLMIIAGCYFIILFSIPYYMENYIDETVEISKDLSEEITTTTLGSRLYLWKETIKAIPKYFLTGCGVSNFEYAFSPALVDPISNRVFDKAHNEYLHKILCEGVICGLIYLVFIVAVFIKYVIKLFKNKKSLDDICFPFFLAFAAYSFQALANISTTRVTPIYFIIMGLIGVEWKKINFRKIKLIKK